MNLIKIIYFKCLGYSPAMSEDKDVMILKLHIAREDITATFQLYKEWIYNNNISVILCKDFVVLFLNQGVKDDTVELTDLGKSIKDKSHLTFYILYELNMGKEQFWHSEDIN